MHCTAYFRGPRPFKFNANRHLHCSRRDRTGSNWTRSGDYYILEKVIRMKDEKDPERAAMLMNHRQFYTKTFRRGMQWIQQVSIHNANVQCEELELLKKHLG